MDASFLSERLETARRTFETLERQLADPDVAANPAQLEPIARERARLEPLVIGYAELQTLRGQEQQARELLREAKQFNPREFRILASQLVIDLFLEEESQHLTMLGDFIGKPISLQVENGFHQEQYDIILM